MEMTEPHHCLLHQLDRLKAVAVECGVFYILLDSGCAKLNRNVAKLRSFFLQNKYKLSITKNCINRYLTGEGGNTSLSTIPVRKFQNKFTPCKENPQISMGHWRNLYTKFQMSKVRLKAESLSKLTVQKYRITWGCSSDSLSKAT